MGKDRRADLDSLPAEDLLKVLAELASALFPKGAGDLAQVTWERLAAGGAGASRPNTAGPEVNAASRRLSAAELRYQTLVDQIPAVTFMAALGEGANEIYVSPHIEALLGFTQQEWLENPFLWYSQLHPDDRELWCQEFAQGCRTGGPFRAECRFLARDGRVVWVRGEARLVKDERGRPLLLQGVAFDITPVKHAHAILLQNAVRATEAQYRDLVERVGAIFCEVERPSGRFSFVSRGAEQVLGFPPERWLADPGFWLTRVHVEDRPAVARAWARVLAEGGDHEHEFRVIAADGRTVWLHQKIRILPQENQDDRLLGIMVDVTDQKQAEEQLAHALAAEQLARAEAEKARLAAETANDAKDVFLATISHELRTPLNAVLGWTMMLRTGAHDEALRGRALEAIERNARAQARLIEDLLDVSRIVAGKLRLEMMPVDLVTIIEAALDTVRPAASAKRLALQSWLDPAASVVAGDANRLRQVMGNLLSNAIKFTPSDGRVGVHLERSERIARIRVVDSGQGISPTLLPHVFEQFRQADSATSRRHGGLGLGLSIVKHLVELHGGTVRAKSAGPGCGAEFLVELPLAVFAEHEDPAVGVQAPERWDDRTPGSRSGAHRSQSSPASAERFSLSLTPTP